jgi:hypothetical protein
MSHTDCLFVTTRKYYGLLVCEDFVNIEMFVVQKWVSYSILVYSLLVCTTAQS